MKQMHGWIVHDEINNINLENRFCADFNYKILTIII